MTRTLRHLAFASTAALAFAAGEARACDVRAELRVDLPGPVWSPEAPVVAPAPPYAPTPGYTSPAAYAPAPPAYAPASSWEAPAVQVRYWRGRGWGALRHEYRRLDLARERFYASWDGSPWSQRRFEAWYGTRRAELERATTSRRHERDDD
ncbi:MAG TPA: hypothetical protein VFE30_12460 [Anaeromyxobacteraceae bacterium]|jgi:hypothetical protein|nr:hypothetical protein [Anaeromyxobacteraceae bacterium]